MSVGDNSYKNKLIPFSSLSLPMWSLVLLFPFCPPFLSSPFGSFARSHIPPHCDCRFSTITKRLRASLPIFARCDSLFLSLSLSRSSFLTLLFSQSCSLVSLTASRVELGCLVMFVRLVVYLFPMCRKSLSLSYILLTIIHDYCPNPFPLCSSYSPFH